MILFKTWKNWNLCPKQSYHSINSIFFLQCSFAFLDFRLLNHFKQVCHKSTELQEFETEKSSVQIDNLLAEDINQKKVNIKQNQLLISIKHNKICISKWTSCLVNKNHNKICFHFDVNQNINQTWRNNGPFSFSSVYHMFMFASIKTLYCNQLSLKRHFYLNVIYIVKYITRTFYFSVFFHQYDTLFLIQSLKTQCNIQSNFKQKSPLGHLNCDRCWQVVVVIYADWLWDSKMIVSETGGCYFKLISSGLDGVWKYCFVVTLVNKFLMHHESLKCKMMKWKCVFANRK